MDPLLWSIKKTEGICAMAENTREEGAVGVWRSNAVRGCCGGKVISLFFYG